MRPNPYSSPIIDMLGERGFGILFSGFLRFFQSFVLYKVYRCVSCSPKGKEKHLQSFGNGFQMTANAECYGIGRIRNAETRRGESGVENGGVRGETGAGGGIPSRQARREKRSAAGRVCLSLARRYNTLDLAGKVSVPRGCGPFGNPGE